MCLEGCGFNGLAGDRGLTPLRLENGKRGTEVSGQRPLFQARLLWRRGEQDCYEAAAGAALGVRFWFLWCSDITACLNVGEDRGWRKTGHWSIRYHAHLRDNLNEPKLLHLLKHRKALKSLTWEVQLLWLAVIFWWLTTRIPSPPWPCPTTTPIYLGSALASLEQFLRATWEAVSHTAALSKVPE